MATVRFGMMYSQSDTIQGSTLLQTDVSLVKAHGLPEGAAPQDAAAAAMADEEQPQRKRRRTGVPSHTQAASERASGLSGSPANGPSSALEDASSPGSAEPKSTRRLEERVHPIDHIFQFHKVSSLSEQCWLFKQGNPAAAMAMGRAGACLLP